MADLASRITKPPAAKEAAVGGADPPSDIAKAQLDGASDADFIDSGAGGSGLNDSNFDVEVVKLSDIQNEEESPLYSVLTFEELGLPKEIIDGLYSMGWMNPSKIQETALPLMLANPPRNMIAQSQSGTGKTGAFAVTILSRIDFAQPTQPQALVLAPTRELAIQTSGVIQGLGKFIPNLQLGLAIRADRTAETKPAPINTRASIIVGTPGTVRDQIRRRGLDVTGLKVLVLDEADNMLDMQSLGEQSVEVKKMLPRDVQKNLQVLLFSATFPERTLKFAEHFAPNANQLRLRPGSEIVKSISQMYMDLENRDDKYECLKSLYGMMTVGSSVIFVDTQRTADEIAEKLISDRHKVSVIHGGLAANIRDSVMDAFRKGEAKVLIATNVLARGIDVNTVSLVINYDIPMSGRRGSREPDGPTYLHRIGRTGRFGRVGVSISFIHDSESYEALKKITSEYGINLVKLTIDDKDATEKMIKKIIQDAYATGVKKVIKPAEKSVIASQTQSDQPLSAVGT